MAGVSETTEDESITTERRFYPRFQLQWPVEVILGDASNRACFAAQAYNISKEGVSLGCSQELTDQLLLLKEPLSQYHLHIMPPDAPDTIKVCCRLITSRRLSQDRYQLGFKILHVEDACEDAGESLLDRYLSILESQTG